MEHNNACHTEQATQNADDGEETIARDECPAHKDQDSSDRGENSADNQGPTGQWWVDTHLSEASEGEGRAQLRTGQRH
jgi:hypothetical protein